jgi:hypothetical protein
VQEQLTEAIGQLPALAEKLLEKAKDLTCADAEDRQACLERKRILLQCAEAARPGRCLRRELAEALCDGADDVQACVDEHTKEELNQIVRDLLEGTVGDVPGVGGVP